MAYYGSTAGSTLANPPALIASAMTKTGSNNTSTGGTGMQLWLYNSSNSTTAALAANFFSDAYYLGMQKGDVVIMPGCTGSTVNLCIGVLGAVTTDGAAIASTGSFISSTFN